MDLRNGDNAIGGLPHLLAMIPGGKRQHIAAPGFHLHNITHGLLKKLCVGTQGHHQCAFLNKADGAVLKFAGSVSLGVNIRNLLELQGTLQPQGIVHIPSDKKHTVMIEILAGKILDIVLVGEDLLHFPRQQQHLLEDGAILFLLHGTQQPRQVQPQQVQHCQLGGIRLGGGYRNLRSRPGIKDLVGFPCNRGTNHIDNRENGSAQPLGLPEGRHGIQCLTRLADDDHQGLFIHNGIHIPELRGQSHLHRDTENPLQVVLAHHSHMVGRAAGHNIQLMDAAQIVFRQAEILQKHLSVPDPGEYGPAHSLRLLHDLLEHEVLIAALFRRIHFPVYVGDLFLHRLHQVVIALDTVFGQHCHLAIIHISHIPGMADDSGNVAGQEAAALTIAQNQRAVLTHRNQLIRLVGADNAQRVGSLDPAHYPAYRLQDAHLVGFTKIFDQLGHHLGIRLRGKRHPLIL